MISHMRQALFLEYLANKASRLSFFVQSQPAEGRQYISDTILRVSIDKRPPETTVQHYILVVWNVYRRQNGRNGNQSQKPFDNVIGVWKTVAKFPEIGRINPSGFPT
jgi:hypothetical protein